MDVVNAVNIAAPITANFEQFSAYPYLDAGSYAIGYGNHYYEDGSAVSADDDAIDQNTAYQLMQFYLQQTASQIAGMFTVDVSDNLLAACTDLAYNWGTGNFQNSKLLQLINQGATPAAIQAQWQVTATTSQGIPNADLVARRAQEASLAFNDVSGPLDVGVLVLAGAFILLFIIYGSKKSR